ncbi:hypothetical protein M409DRAFT_57907 [Zasmidium cellare ATCC 36951]|uniref:Uncharacterized protein n=1 Tax=Zasmidium cellare ATCC 36951 TaxID=1080233 RepID=A0A6A6C9D2_ZASCE|nr:uncharacterized protein M409DRAFT_57907 [Zasmidium cellare ATCC 36951]KAF2162848.1 hypothetical protein M409DRAFT_57907 [Zasmidium cellare ATCC 36951]
MQTVSVGAVTAFTSSEEMDIADGSKEPRAITAEILPLYEPSTLSRTSPTSLPELERVSAAAHPCQTSKATSRHHSLFEPVRETSKRRKIAQGASDAWRAVKRAALRVREATRRR